MGRVRSSLCRAVRQRSESRLCDNGWPGSEGGSVFLFYAIRYRVLQYCPRWITELGTGGQMDYRSVRNLLPEYAIHPRLGGANSDRRRNCFLTGGLRLRGGSTSRE